jgi:hypothetical protein
MANKLKINPPLFLVSTNWPCWKCDTRIPLAALLAIKVDEINGDICKLTNITQLPNEVLDFIQSRVPSFKYSFSMTIGTKYFANTCPNCGVMQGDFYLHSEPGSPFFPMDKKEARALFMTEIPLTEPIWVEADYELGAPCEMIYTHAKRI